LHKNNQYECCFQFSSLWHRFSLVCAAERPMSAQRIRASCAMGYAQRFKEGRYAQRLMRDQRIRAILLAEAWSRSMLLPKGSRQNLR
jgi:hypothetical protein